MWFSREPDIEKLKARRDVKGLIKALRYEFSYTRRKAAEALGELGDSRSVEPLIIGLKDENMDVREACAEALGRIGDPLAVIPLIDTLKDNQDISLREVRKKAAIALGKIRDPCAIEPLLYLLRDSYYEFGNVVVVALVNIGAQAVGPLINALKSDHKDVRKGAAEALRKIGDPRAIEPLIFALKGAYYDLGEVIVGALVETGSQAVGPLIDALKNTDDDVRQGAAEALGNIGDPRAIEPLINTLKDQDRLVRIAAVEALGNLGDPRAVEPLSDMLKDPDKYARDAAVQALMKIGDPAVESLITGLIPMLMDPDINYRGEVAKTLDRLGWKPLSDEHKVYYAIAKKDWESCVALGVVAVQPLITLLEDRLVRSDVIQALGKIGDVRAVEPLVRMLNDEEKYVRFFSIRALEMIGSSMAVDALIGCLKDRDEGVRNAAIRALGVIGDNRAIEPLLYLLMNSNLEERNSIANSLVSLYRSGKLDVRHAQMILNQRSLITQKEHIDQYGYHSDTDDDKDSINRTCHTDYQSHEDSTYHGIEL